MAAILIFLLFFSLFLNGYLLSRIRSSKDEIDVLRGFVGVGKGVSDLKAKKRPRDDFEVYDGGLEDCEDE